MLIRHVDEIPPSAATVDAGDRVSRRLVLAHDRADYSLHDPLMRANDRTLFDVPHRLESADCIEGGQSADTRPALRKKNVFVVGLDEFNRNRLRSIRNAENYNFIKLLDTRDVLEQKKYDIDTMLSKARAELDAYPGAVDSLIHYIDFPVSTTIPILCREFGLPSATLEAVLKCEHKYWSRLEQRRCIPEHVPQFAAFDPFDDHALDNLSLDFPFWVKPIKSFSSYLGFFIRHNDDWNTAIHEIRANINRFEAPFDDLLSRVELPHEVRDIGGGSCIAEAIIGGRMCTQEGYVHKGKLHVYGTVDSLREPGGSSFASYQYPSRLPARVRKRMTRIVETFMAHIGYDNAPFNVEFFWDANTDQIWLLEVNPRISESHADLFHKVDGASHHEIATDLSLGARPRLPYRDGEFSCAGKFFIRAYHDAVVTRVPGAEALARIEQLMPDTIVKIIPQPGQRLSTLMDQDSYSYILALLWIGASSPRQLQRRYEQAVQMLEFELESIAE